MNTTLTRKIATALLCGSVLAAAAPAAYADRDDRGPRWGHHKHHGADIGRPLSALSEQN